MRQHSNSAKDTAEKVVKDIRRATRKQYSAEEKIRIVLEGLRGEDSIAELCRQHRIARSTARDQGPASHAADPRPCLGCLRVAPGADRVARRCGLCIRIAGLSPVTARQFRLWSCVGRMAVGGGTRRPSWARDEPRQPECFLFPAGELLDDRRRHFVDRCADRAAPDRQDQGRRGVGRKDVIAARPRKPRGRKEPTSVSGSCANAASKIRARSANIREAARHWRCGRPQSRRASHPECGSG
jgi:transposase